MKVCKNCGNYIDDNQKYCEKCGEYNDGITVENAGQQITKKTNGMAIAGFVCSFFIPLLGWIFGGIGLKKSKETNSGYGLSVAAIIIASIMFVLNFLELMSNY